jgi:hypothetical protein
MPLLQRNRNTTLQEPIGRGTTPKPTRFNRTGAQRVTSYRRPRESHVAPAVREFLDGLATMIARRILAGADGKAPEYIIRSPKPRAGHKC